MFTMDYVHARDHGPGCSVASVQSRPQGVHEVSLILCPFRNVTRGRKQRSPQNTWKP